MTREESKHLKIGARVRWQGNETDEGTVAENDWKAVRIVWDNKLTSVIHHNDMSSVKPAT